MKASGPHPHLRRAALLLAALLHLLGVAAGPVLHGWTRPDPHHPGWSAERSDLSAPHDEQACAICQAATDRAVPEPGVPPRVALESARTFSAAVPTFHASPGRTGPGARAPPVSPA